MKKLLFLCCLMASMLCMACAQQPKFTSSKHAIRVSANNPVFVITLQSNRTTGYAWQAKTYDKKIIKLLHHQYVAPKTKLFGAPGYAVWTFRLVPNTIAKTQIVMEYKRPWTKAGATTETFHVVLDTHSL